MSRSGRDPGERLRTAKKRSTSSARWLQRQLNDPYVRQAKAEGYRSRAAYKLIELDEKFSLLKGVTRAVDLGIAPGGWSQVLRLKCPKAKVVGIDLLPTDPIEGVTGVSIHHGAKVTRDGTAVWAEAATGSPRAKSKTMARTAIPP